MSIQSFFEKLQFNDEKNILIQGLPSSIEKQFAKISYSKNVTPLLRSKKIDFALIFAVNQNQLSNILLEVFPALHEESKLWIAYPKTASKIASDLNRDCSWQILVDNDYESVRQVALDHVWTALRFKKLESIPSHSAAYVEVQHAVMKGIDVENRIVSPPAELESIFVKHHKAKEFFTSLSFTNQKEYVTWIEGAKKEETKRRRIAVVQEKLLAGKKNPSEK